MQKSVQLVEFCNTEQRIRQKQKIKEKVLNIYNFIIYFRLYLFLFFFFHYIFISLNFLSILFFFLLCSSHLFLSVLYFLTSFFLYFNYNSIDSWLNHSQTKFEWEYSITILYYFFQILKLRFWNIINLYFNFNFVPNKTYRWIW